MQDKLILEFCHCFLKKFFLILFYLIVGDGSSESGYNPNNVSERDFLRTEGDPGAAGYTIKEAVALTRSVVSKNYFCHHQLKISMCSIAVMDVLGKLL